MMFKRPADEKQVARFESEMERCLSEISDVWLEGGNKKFLTGDKISIADIVACTELEQPGMLLHIQLASFSVSTFHVL